MARAVKSGFMPYKIEANPVVESLAEAEKQAILDWLEAGAPREICDPNAPPPKRTKGGNAKPTTSARPTTSAKTTTSAKPTGSAKPTTSATQKLPVATGKTQG